MNISYICTYRVISRYLCKHFIWQNKDHFFKMLTPQKISTVLLKNNLNDIGKNLTCHTWTSKYQPILLRIFSSATSVSFESIWVSQHLRSIKSKHLKEKNRILDSILGPCHPQSLQQYLESRCQDLFAPPALRWKEHWSGGQEDWICYICLLKYS